MSVKGLPNWFLTHVMVCKCLPCGPRYVPSDGQACSGTRHAPDQTRSSKGDMQIRPPLVFDCRELNPTEAVKNIPQSLKCIFCSGALCSPGVCFFFVSSLQGRLRVLFSRVQESGVQGSSTLRFSINVYQPIAPIVGLDLCSFSNVSSLREHYACPREVRLQAGLSILRFVMPLGHFFWTPHLSWGAGV